MKKFIQLDLIKIIHVPKNNKQPPQKKFAPPMKNHNKLIKSTTVAEKADLWGNFIITILTRTGLHNSDCI